jgi:hypothetical protein
MSRLIIRSGVPSSTACVEMVLRSGDFYGTETTSLA